MQDVQHRRLSCIGDAVASTNIGLLAILVTLNVAAFVGLVGLASRGTGIALAIFLCGFVVWLRRDLCARMTLIGIALRGKVRCVSGFVPDSVSLRPGTQSRIVVLCVRNSVNAQGVVNSNSPIELDVAVSGNKVTSVELIANTAEDPAADLGERWIAFRAQCRSGRTDIQISKRTGTLEPVSYTMYTSE
ncbi:MAG: hypothetical protein AAF937_05780 [Planctomycetota bacterium]